MKKFKITYQPFPQSDATSSDIVIPAESEEEAKKVFVEKYSNTIFTFVKAEQIG